MTTVQLQSNSIPENVKDMLNASLCDAIRRTFTDPKVAKEYKEWKKAREGKHEQS